MKAFYAAKVSLVDRWLGTLLDALEETGLDRNTAVVLTADHGTCVGEFSLFTKRIYGQTGEQEAHVPLMISIPGQAAARSDRFAQPQDIFVTILGLAGVRPPEPADGQNLFEPGEQRALAISGGSVDSWLWSGKPSRLLFTVFGDTHYLNFSPYPGESRLFRYGSQVDEASGCPELVRDLWRAGLDEAVRRGTDPRLVEWICSEGSAEYPRDASRWPGPPGFVAYWGRTYNRW